MQMKPACSFPMRESLLDQLLNRFIALHKLCPRLLLAPFAFGTRVTQQRSACRRRRDQVNAFECLAMLSEDVLDDFGQIAQHMEPIRCLGRFGSPKAGATGDLSAAISANQLDSWMRPEPRFHGGRLMIGKHINR